MTKSQRHLDSSNDARSGAVVRASAAAGVVTFAALMTAFTGGAATAATNDTLGTGATGMSSVSVDDTVGDDYVPEETGLSTEIPGILPADAPAADPADPASPRDGLAVTGADAGLIASLAGLFIAGGAVITIAGSTARRRAARSKA